MPDLNQHFEVLNELLKRGRFGLISDVDGTLSEIAPTPEAARLDPACRRALETLREKLALVALVSGRSAADLQDMVGIPGLVYVGNHGLARGDTAEALKGQVTTALAALKSKLGDEGLLYEDKGVTAAIHYRASADPAAARQRILNVISKIPETDGLKVQENRLVVELMPPGGTGKGGAVTALREDYRLDAALYLGDDRTDIAAFDALREAAAGTEFKGLSAAVLSNEMPPELAAAADFTLEGVPGVAALLTRLAAANPA